MSGTFSDMIAALECRVTAGAAPIWELEFHAWDSASGRHVVLGHEFESLSAERQDRALHENAEIILSVCADFHYSALTVPGFYWEQAPGELAYWCLPPRARYRQLEILRKLAPPDLMLVASSGGVMAMPDATHYEEFCYQLFDAPELIDEKAQRTLREALETAKRLRDAGAQAVFTASDIADNRGPFFNPRQMDRFILPYLRQWAEQIRAMGLYAILHSDGDLSPCLNAIADTGVHALQAIDPVAGMDMLSAKKQVAGRICLCGNIDCGLLLTGTPQSVYDATRALLDSCAPGGGFVLGTSNAVQTEVPMKNYRAMIRALPPNHQKWSRAVG